MEKNIGNPELTVNSVAQWVYLSNSYLRNIFREVTGETLSNYIIEKKLERICTLLEQTQMSAQQIADTMGFHSKSYLLTFFKNYMGMTPTQYRKEKTQENRETGGKKTICGLEERIFNGKAEGSIFDNPLLCRFLDYSGKGFSHNMRAEQKTDWRKKNEEKTCKVWQRIDL